MYYSTRQKKVFLLNHGLSTNLIFLRGENRPPLERKYIRVNVNGNLERVVGPLALRQRRKEIKSILGGGKRVRADSSV